MKCNISVLFILFLFFVSLPHTQYAQDSAEDEFSFEIHRVHPYISISKEELIQAETLADLDMNYKNTWVRSYISVEIVALVNGKYQKATSVNDTLTVEQKQLMEGADVGHDITVNAHYMPENTLSSNEEQLMNFTFFVNPEKDASYTSGEKEMMQYLSTNAIDHIADDVFSGYLLSAVKFMVDEEGNIIDAHILESSKDAVTDTLLLEAICNMPKWTPAEYSNGTHVKQEYVFAVGNMKSCTVNLLGIRLNNW